ncbi:nitric oxide reductase activation protein [Candidatus Thiothrix sp. Deng01]|uniref:Nitric oxide reductase activation protein n=1 Tax=Candidatus Thiothrix phosphatis TaxID=3112415 RepID=A0ABU6D516_9GAMM|nr:nitric oxide reductase activation protein [Candidatus Thiothrix sp. Deng01]MEB4593407.1 nitric oxide reductase activation protein [Candidatus Thiothrix sp. Deng01]
MKASREPYTAAFLWERLEELFEVEFTFLKVEGLVVALAPLDRDTQDFILGWAVRLLSTNLYISHEFTIRVVDALDRLERRVIEAWALHAADTFDRSGLRPALEVIQQVDSFLLNAHAHAEGVTFAEVEPVLSTFVCGLAGRRLTLAQGEQVYTDSETLFLPNISAQMEKAKDNFLLCKAQVAFMWAQTRFGSFRVDFATAFAQYPDREQALAAFHALDTLRLEACLERELPGLWRDMQRLERLNTPHPDLPPQGGKGQEGIPDKDSVLPSSLVGEGLGMGGRVVARLQSPDATINDVLALLPEVLGMAFPPRVYQPRLNPEAVTACMLARMGQEKILFRVKLAELAKELGKGKEETPPNLPLSGEEQEKLPPEFEAREAQQGEGMELVLEDKPIAPPEDVKQLMTSIMLDWGEIPPEFLVPAGDGEYDPALYQKEEKDVEDVWKGVYHEEGAFLYSEWDHARQHYRKNWCVLREIEMTAGDPAYVEGVQEKYQGLVKHLRRTFEAMRDENRLLKRQAQGDDVDIDALVEALADSRDGSEMSDKLFQQMHRADRNLAVMLMVDMSGSTKGWINEAEREALVMLCEVLETLGDRYAIYGFSGIGRKRCEIYHIKRFDERYDAATKARIAGIVPKDYTRMGVAIRHLSQKLNEVEAKTRLLITLSDGKPEDYFDIYNTQYGIEDTRQALFEARRTGIHPFCITIDRRGKDYLPHMYGHANWVEIDDVKKLPLKVADIYRRLTT